MKIPLALYKQIFDQTQLSIQIYDNNGNLIIVNDSNKILFGIKNINALSKNNLFENPFIPENLFDKIKNGESVRFICYYDFEKVRQNKLYSSSKTGYLWLEIIINSFIENKKQFFISYFIDLTREKNSQIELINKEKIFEDMFDNHLSPMLIIDRKDGKIIKSNRSAETFYGYSTKKIRKLAFDDLRSFSEKNENSDKNIDAVNEYKHILSNGEIRVVDIISTPMVFRDQEVVFSIINDITERKKIEKELIYQKEMLENIFENAPLGVVTLSLDGTIITVNKYSQEISGYTKEDIVQKKFVEIIHPDDSKKI
jgi:PAS domain S-box-containing protein